jgi:hypothetical protein
MHQRPGLWPGDRSRLKRAYRSGFNARFSRLSEAGAKDPLIKKKIMHHPKPCGYQKCCVWPVKITGKRAFHADYYVETGCAEKATWWHGNTWERLEQLRSENLGGSGRVARRRPATRGSFCRCLPAARIKCPARGRAPSSRLLPPFFFHLLV